MPDIKEKVRTEMENITRVLHEIEKVRNNSNKELIVLVGIGAYLQNIYTGMENILKQLLSHKGIDIPDTPTWHKDVLNLAINNHFICAETSNKIGKYLVFRHFFMHAYGFLIDEAKLGNYIDNSL